MNTMIVDGFTAKIEDDADLDAFRGEIMGLNGGADFFGKNPKELRAEFKKPLQVFLEVCREKRGSSLATATLAGSICASLPDFMSALQSWPRRRGRASMPSPRRRFNSAWQRTDGERVAGKRQDLTPNAHEARSGCLQRRPLKRLKSRSVVIHSQPDSIAIAAR